MSSLKALGTNTTYTDKYDPSLLEGFGRRERRKDHVVPMFGADIWTAYEVSFLLPNGIPKFLVLRILNPADSKNIFESKSLKLYLNSFNNTVLKNTEELISIIIEDLSTVAQAEVEVEQVFSFKDGKSFYEESLNLEKYIKPGTVFKEYSYNPKLLQTKPAKILRSKLIELDSDLLRSNCEITNQPDWGRVYIKYEPGEVEVTFESLLQYIVSIRTHQMFHEPTCELIFNDLYKKLNPKSLLVVCQYTRRGGIDINPYRYTDGTLIKDLPQFLPKLNQQ